MKVKFGLVVTDGRGKLGGHVMSKNRSGNYIRTKVTPSNPKTAAQTAQRALLSQFSQGWKGLTQLQRNAWLSAVDGFQKTNIFGDNVKPSGNTLYTRLNINVAIAGGSALTLPPESVGVDALTSISGTASESSGDFDVTVGPATTPADHALIIEATEQLSQGISNANNKFRQIAVDPALVAGVVDLSTIYSDRFGTLIAGKKIFVRAKYIRKTTGEVSQYLKTSIIVA